MKKFHTEMQEKKNTNESMVTEATKVKKLSEDRTVVNDHLMRDI